MTAPPVGTPVRMPIRMPIGFSGDRMRAAREARGLSQAQLANRCGLMPSAVSHAETGKREPSSGTLARLCRALGVSADWLLGLERMEAPGELMRLRAFRDAVVEAAKRTEAP